MNDIFNTALLIKQKWRNVGQSVFLLAYMDKDEEKN
nr:MAG TPA: hypothetical protein [Caudoviricetes sp.]